MKKVQEDLGLEKKKTQEPDKCIDCGKILTDTKYFCEECQIKRDRERTEQEEKRKAFEEIEKKDEEVIAKELAYEPVSDYVYAIPFRCKDGTTKYAYGLGIAGINAIAQLFGGILRRVDFIRKVYDNGLPYWEVQATAIDILLGNAVSERYRQPATMRRGEDDMRGDLALVIAQRKALRNVVSQLIPQGIKVRLIELAKSGKQISSEQLESLVAGMGGALRKKKMMQLFSRKGIQIFGSFQEPESLELPKAKEEKNGEKEEDIPY